MYIGRVKRHSCNGVLRVLSVDTMTDIRITRGCHAKLRSCLWVYMLFITTSHTSLEKAPLFFKKCTPRELKLHLKFQRFLQLKKTDSQVVALSVFF